MGKFNIITYPPEKRFTKQYETLLKCKLKRAGMIKKDIIFSLFLMEILPAKSKAKAVISSYRCFDMMQLKTYNELSS